MKPVILVSGPTASGKSDLALMIAESLGGEIVNIDSVQVYRDLNIGSAKTVGDAQRGIAHHLVGVKDPNEKIDAAWFVKKARACIEDIQKRGKACILCSGTTMYITHIFHGLAALPGADENIRRMLRSKPVEELYAELLNRDANSAAKIHPNDRIRIERAIEACEISGKKASEIQAEHGFSASDLKAVFIILCWPRDELYERIDLRSRKMFSDGLIEETKGVIEKYGDKLFALKSLGYAQALKVIKGELSLEAAVIEVQKETRNFAKRQCTFWRNEPQKRGWTVYPALTEKAKELKSKNEFYKTHKRVNDFRVYEYSFGDLQANVLKRIEAVLENNQVFFLDAKKVLKS